MGLERVPSSDEASSGLEAFKGNADAPFETVGKNEEPPTYPYTFLNKLKTSWSKVCDLMDWEKAAQPVDWNFFRVSRNPFVVVTSIQKKILENGGSLPSYGVDGKFGSETQGALNDLMAKRDESTTARAQVDVAADLTATASSQLDRVGRTEAVSAGKLERRGSMNRLMQQKMREMFDALPRIEARLEAAGLDIDRDWLKDPNFSDADVIGFQTRAMEFREDLITKEPRLEPLNRLVQKLIPEIETEIRKIDLAKINSMEDLVRVIGELGKTLEAKMDSMKDVLSDEKMEELIREVDIEVLMAFFMASFNELAVLMARYFKENKQNFERIMKIFEDEFLVHVRPKVEKALGGARIDADVFVRDLPPNWHELVLRGPVSSGTLEFSKEGRSVVLNLDDLTLKVGDKTARLNLPESVTLDSIQAQVDGSIVLNASLNGFSGRQVLSRTDLDSYLSKIAGVDRGERIDIGKGAYLQV
ncbi:hypothetical protein HYW83_02475 [Candidatus Peregrinibacteria bacterium]|nr:hypothetical protein [Candidatus Peregrinibacteria bacterium]